MTIYFFQRKFVCKFLHLNGHVYHQFSIIVTFIGKTSQWQLCLFIILSYNNSTFFSGTCTFCLFFLFGCFLLRYKLFTISASKIQIILSASQKSKWNSHKSFMWPHSDFRWGYKLAVFYQGWLLTLWDSRV